MTLSLGELNARVEQANKRGGNLDLRNLTSIPEGFNPKKKDRENIPVFINQN